VHVEGRGMRALRYYYGKGKEGRGWEGGEGRAGQERNLRGKISVYGRNPFNLIFSVFSVINLLLNFKCVIVIYNFSITNFVTEIRTVYYCYHWCCCLNPLIADVRARPRK